MTKKTAVKPNQYRVEIDGNFHSSQQWFDDAAQTAYSLRKQYGEKAVRAYGPDGEIAKPAGERGW